MRRTVGQVWCEEERREDGQEEGLRKTHRNSERGRITEEETEKYNVNELLS